MGAEKLQTACGTRSAGIGEASPHAPLGSSRLGAAREAAREGLEGSASPTRGSPVQRTQEASSKGGSRTTRRS